MNFNVFALLAAKQAVQGYFGEILCYLTEPTPMKI